MKKLFLFYLLLSGLTAMAQDVMFLENFDDNFRAWSTTDNENYSTEIFDGHYLISHKRESGSWYFWNGFNVDENKDFTIIAKIQQTDGIIDNGYGLVWGSKNVDNSYKIAISSNGYVKVVKNDNGTYEEFLKWKKVKIINPKGEYNTIKLVKKGKTLTFYVNDAKVYKMKNPPFFGKNVGFVLYDNMKIMVDYIEIQQPGSPFLVVEKPINGYIKENLGENINSEYDELTPLIAPDGKTLFVCRDEHPENTGDKLKNDIWYSELDKDGNWTKLKNIGTPLNNAGHNSVVSVSPDGNTVLLMNTYNSDGSAKGSGISMSTRSGSGWSIPATIEIKDFYNDSKYNEFCLSSNKKILLMTVQRKDSYGDKDIYVSFDKNGVFTAPMNLGPVVNSFDNEASPFLASDEKTLYYSSKGKPGYGSSDIFVTRRLDDTWKNWSPPRNLGPEINSADWDAYYTIPASGDYAYLVSQDNSIGQGDIFRIKPPEAAKPEPVLLIYGKVLNKKNNEPMEAFITYNNLMTDEEIGTAVSDSKTGEYKIILPLGTNYSFRAAQEGFYPVSDNLDVSTLENYGEIERNLYLSPIEVGETIRLNNIFFDLDKATLKEESFSELNRLVRLLKENATMSITISGHTDNQGSDQYNLKLSEDRVNSVIQYLITNGVAKDRLSGKGYGESNPIGTNDTEEGKAINRRVEFTIDKK